jgi:hypothetical protein
MREPELMSPADVGAVAAALRVSDQIVDLLAGDQISDRLGHDESLRNMVEVTGSGLRRSVVRARRSS